jgi:arylsulfatase
MVKTMSQSRHKSLKNLVLSFIALAITASSGFLYCQKGEQNPNIILIFIDDQGYADVGCYGAKGFETPNLDQMAAEGMRFTSFYASQAVCSASRASLLTGCYAERVSIRGALNPRATVGINSEEVTIAEMLKEQGYATGIFGKWHLGHHNKFLPLQHGFDEYLGIPYSNDMWPVGYDGIPLEEGRKSIYPVLPLIGDNEKVDEIRTLEDQATLTTRYTERAVKFIEKNKDIPFFLYRPHTMVHVPLGVSSKFRGKSEQGMYGDVMMEIDWSVGEILKTLKEHNLEDNTLVIYTSDNGPWLNYGNHAGLAVPLREGKGTAWEGGVRVPCIMRWPKRIPAGSICEKLASTIDVLPTLATITGSELPVNPIDGVSILPLMEDEKSANPRNHFYYFYTEELRAVRQGNWKMILPHTSRSYQGVEPGNDGYPGPTASLSVDFELYDLEKDVSETQNVIDQYPEVVKELKLLADKARKELGDHLTGAKGKMNREPGRIVTQKRERVQHVAIGKKISLRKSFSPRYTGGKDNALVDGIRGTIDYMDGTWQGFEYVDLETIIDLGNVQTVRQITCSFLENQVSWIFLPKSIEMAVSHDGTKYDVVGDFNIKSNQFNTGARVKDYSKEFEKKQIRYIRVKAQNMGVCPDWHPESGGKAWLFADEIIVK